MGLFDNQAQSGSIADLNKAWADCQKCPLRLPGFIPCPGRGMESARVIIVGQAPTRNESETGIMMADRGGQEIRSWFADIAPHWQMRADQLYFTNVVKCCTTLKSNPNKGVPFVEEDGRLGATVIPAQECGPWLEEEIRLINPELIISIGSLALSRFSQADPISLIPNGLDKARGRVWNYRGHKFVAITMPTRLSEYNPELDEDAEFLRTCLEEKDAGQTKTFAPSIPTLEAAFGHVEVCAACSLNATANCRVFGTGWGRAPLAIVGEAPGQTEDQEGVPFIGPAGEVLRSSLRDLGVDDTAVYITNAVKCWPGDGNPTPTDDQVEACLGHLQTQLKNVRPKVVLALGRTAAWALLKDHSPMGRIRGQARQCWFLPSALVVPTWHPSYVLRDSQHKANSPVKREFIHDLNVALELARKDKP